MERSQRLQNATLHELASSLATSPERIFSNTDKQQNIHFSLPSPTYLLNKRSLNLIAEDGPTPDLSPDSSDRMPSDSIAPEPATWRNPKCAKKDADDYISARGSAEITDVFHTIGDPLPATDASLASPPAQRPPRNLYLSSLRRSSFSDRMSACSQLVGQPVGDANLEFSQVLTYSNIYSPTSLGGSPAKENSGEVFSTTGSSSCKQLKQCISVFTPPDEESQINWELPSDKNVSSASKLERDDDDDEEEEEKGPKVLADRSIVTRPDIDGVDTSTWMNSLDCKDHWLSDALKIIIAHVGETSSQHSAINVLSQALPFPSLSGHAFSCIRSMLEQNTNVKIRFCHAVSTALSLSDIPTPPLGSPGSGLDGEDYFSPKTYESAVAVRDYQGPSKGLLPSPNPVVPPSTIQVSILERYIPPTSCNEIVSLFDPTGPCLLVDRLVELSPDGGKLLFIYPTQKGGKTFASKYLGPIIDPLLRSMTVVDGLFSDLASILGRMQSIDTLYPYDDLKSKIESLCERLSSRGKASRGRYHGQPTTFSVVYAAPKTIKLERKIWSREWWVRQEELRIRTSVKRYFDAVQKLPDGSDAAHTRLIQSVLDGVMSRPYPDNIEPEEEIEVGLFVIMRST